MLSQFRHDQITQQRGMFLIAEVVLIQKALAPAPAIPAAESGAHA